MDVRNRDATLEFLSNHVKTDMLMKHLFSVEAVIPIGAIRPRRQPFPDHRMGKTRTMASLSRSRF